MRWKAGESKTAEEGSNRVWGHDARLDIKERGADSYIYPTHPALRGTRSRRLCSRQRKEEEGGEKEASFSFPSSFRSASSISVTV